MATISFPNLYTHRKVAETKAKSCDICYRLTSSVLITPDNKDFFYLCPSHLKEPALCTPKIDTEAIEARRKKELEEEVERVKKEYEEKQKKKKEEKEKEKKKDQKDGEKSKDKDEKKDEKDQEKSKGSSSRSASREGTKSPPVEEEPRIFELKPTFYQQRLLKKRQAEIAKRNRERLQDPTFFPSVPKNLP
ncbi:VPS4-associated protein 1 [Pseudoneurospora amorphoporcata]|uniref:VPS4-associated protein 1 n=1 Tax=Pseudoneurospora amorphoporcata TaxID=241081 RepID=A0AAN6NK49_9PEZI|nr:VPS4-associated protein 1 [Pseudoneurospora amorphoporcata]